AGDHLHKIARHKYDMAQAETDAIVEENTKADREEQRGYRRSGGEKTDGRQAAGHVTFDVKNFFNLLNILSIIKYYLLYYLHLILFRTCIEAKTTSIPHCLTGPWRSFVISVFFWLWCAPKIKCAVLCRKATCVRARMN